MEMAAETLLRPFCRVSVFCCRVFVAEKSVGRLVLLDFRETADRRVEAVVGVVVVALADLAEQDGAGAGLDGEVVVQVLRDVDALARGQTDLRAAGTVYALPSQWTVTSETLSMDSSGRLL